MVLIFKTITASPKGKENVDKFCEAKITGSVFIASVYAGMDTIG